MSSFPVVLLNDYLSKGLDCTRHPILGANMLSKLLSALSHGNIPHDLPDGSSTSMSKPLPPSGERASHEERVL
jgi:hypothetical protein